MVAYSASGSSGGTRVGDEARRVTGVAAALGRDCLNTALLLLGDDSMELRTEGNVPQRETRESSVV